VFEADDVGHDGVVEGAMVALRDGDGDAFVLVIDLDEYLWRFEIFDLLFDQLVARLLG
jgi:hypothetical protein